MKKTASAVLLAAIFLTSCELFNSYGKKVEVGDNIEVYYKGKGVTEEQAQTLGEFMKNRGFGDKDFSMQITMPEGEKSYIVKMVYQEDYYKKHKEALDHTFSVMTDQISEKVFDGDPVVIELVDDKMKEYVTVDPISKMKIGDNNYIYYNSEEVSKKAVQDMGEKLNKESFFTSYASSKVYLSKEDGDYVFRFQPNQKLLKEKGQSDYYIMMENVQYILTKYTLEKDVKLVLVDKEFNETQTFKNPPADRQAQIDQMLKGGQAEQTTEPQTTTADDDDIEGGGMDNQQR